MGGERIVTDQSGMCLGLGNGMTEKEGNWRIWEESNKDDQITVNSKAEATI